MKKFQTRLALQQSKLAQHIRNLDGFIQGARFDLLSTAEQALILCQLDAMRELNTVLSNRCRFHEITPEPCERLTK
jgi:hypothetical protein